MDTHRLALLTETLYHSDGQILEEVYVYGSFLQSKMYHAGVTCSDCHEPHSSKVRASGNALCGRCHLPKKYDTRAHHFHEPDSPGAHCVECHMPAKNYMVVDPRLDHSIRVPRPDLSVKLGTPNACNGCHKDRKAQWAADAVSKWYGPARSSEPHFGEALYAGQKGLPGAGDALVKLASDSAKPNIARASAFSLLRRYPSPTSVRAIQHGLVDNDPLVRAAALSALDALEPKDRFGIAYPLLNDPVRIVRVEAASVLASAPRTMMTPEQRASLDRAIAEYIQAQSVNADRPGSHLNLGLLYTRTGELAKAEVAYRTADLHHALGLLLVRQKRMAEAVEALGESAGLGADNPRYSYVYAVALNAIGRRQDAVQVLDETHVRHPNDREVLYGLVTFNRDMGNLDAATRHAEKLVALSPQDPTARRLLDQLKQR